MAAIVTCIVLGELKKTLQQKMGETPNFDDLKVECNSHRLEHCFRFLFMQEAAENESFIELVAEECEVVTNRMQQRQQLL